MLQGSEAFQEYQRLKLRDRCEQSLSEFFSNAWPSIEPGTKYVHNWHIDAVCEHLEAASYGHIPRLLINLPPRCGKTDLVSVAWPAWIWAQLDPTPLLGPQVQFLCGSYAHTLSLAISVKMRRLVESKWYQDLWGDRFTFSLDQKTKTRYDTDRGGSRLATSVGGALLGLGGNIVIVDDPHNTERVESEVERDRVVNWWKEISSTRFNDPATGCAVVIMQRLHQQDVSGYILEHDKNKEWTFLMIPMEYEQRRHCHTVLSWKEEEDKIVPDVTWDDPRTDEGQLLDPLRFGPREVRNQKDNLGPYLASGRLQQSPTPKGGGIFKEEWWQPWPIPGSHFDETKPLPVPPMEYVVASLDTAFDVQRENDFSALTVWGVWRGATEARTHDSRRLLAPDGSVEELPPSPDQDRQKAMLLYAWAKRLELHGPPEERPPGMTDAKWNSKEMKEERQRHWGLVEHTVDTCRRFKIDCLLIEAKATGTTVAQELRRLYQNEDFSVILVNPDEFGDKVARAYKVQHLFSNRLIYGPFHPQTGVGIYTWFNQLLDDLGRFPKGTHDDLVDSTTQALGYLRDRGFLRRTDEFERDMVEVTRPYRHVKPLYDM